MSDYELPASIPGPRTSPEYMHEGPVYPGEHLHEAMGLNTAHALSAHMIRRARMGMNRPAGPGHVEAAAGIRDALRPGANPSRATDLDDELEPVTSPYDEEEAARQNPHEYQSPVARRLRSGGSTSDPARRTSTTPRTRRGPGGPSRP
jgi:hypothetical protein